MSKVALISDIHVGGARNDNEAIAEHQEKFFSQIFFPYLINHNIKQVVILGDLFERRKFINFKSLKKAREMFFDVASMHNILLTIFVGNHDVYDRNTNHTNSPELLLKGYTNIELLHHTIPTEYVFDSGLRVGMIPWISDSEESKEIAFSFLRTTQANIIFGHFDIVGFEMTPGNYCEDGIDPTVFSRFDMVLSGHYHNKSKIGNIQYLGSQYEMDWNDYGVEKYFHIFDTETTELVGIKNPNTMFTKLYYKNGWDKVETVNKKHVKVIVVEKEDPYKFDSAIEELRVQNPESLHIIDSEVLINIEEDNVDVSRLDHVIKTQIDQITDKSSEFKKKVNEVMQNLYKEAQSV